tara:strand:+ start:98 stop:403 length:306 start_codon:yes stop_codon:yes gene_type:complete
VVIYIREAHAMDSRLPMMFGNIEDPVTYEERRVMANFSSKELGMEIPAVVDELDDAVSMAYQGWPERLYLIAPDGEVLYRCGPGPFGFDPDGLEQAILDLR